MKVHPAIWAGGAAVVLYLFFKHKSSASASPAPSAATNYSPQYSPQKTAATGGTGPTPAQQAQIAANQAAAQAEVDQLQAQQDIQSFQNLGGPSAMIPGSS